MAVVAPEARQRCQVAGLARASCGPATCNAETVDVARWMHGAPPMESVETHRGTCPQTGSCRLLLDPQNNTFPLCRAAIFVVDVPSYRHGQLSFLPRRPFIDGLLVHAHPPQGSQKVMNPQKPFKQIT